MGNISPLVHMTPADFPMVDGGLQEAHSKFRSTRKLLESCLGTQMYIVKCFLCLLSDCIFIFHHVEVDTLLVGFR